MKLFSHFPYSILAFLAAALFITGCDDDDNPIKENMAVITSIDPLTGPVGTEVKLIGSNFDETMEDHTVVFNGGSQAVISAVTNEQITVMVPEGATTGRISLTTKGRTITSPVFTVTAPETAITALRPNQLAEGMSVKVIGTNFGDAVTDHVVMLNGKEASISSVTDNEITVVVPAGVTAGAVSLTLDGKTYEGPAFTILEEDVDLSEGFTMDAGIATIGEAFVYDDQAVEGITALRLTPAKSDRVGVAYYGTRIPVENGFETTFDFRISRPERAAGQTGELGAEGIAFIIQNDPAGLEARGFRGGSLGYAGITNAVAIEFDAYNNQEPSLGDLDGNHISVQANTDPDDQYGRLYAENYHSLGHTTQESNPNLPEFIGNETSRHTAKIVYTPGMLQVYLDDMSAPALEVEMTITDYMQLVDGKAFVGFTAATGVDSSWAAHDILNWTLQPTTGSGE